jgi:pyridoxal phosphate enzyme (YggS family)
VEDRLQAVCRRVGRSREEITLVAVTKSVDAEIAGQLHQLGVVDLGESRPQELWHKAAILPSSVRWHLVGHLQRNKVERSLPLVHLIHSVDSMRLLQTLEEQANIRGHHADVLLEVNVSGETAKHGFTPSELSPLVESINQLRAVRIRGLMTMAPFEEDPQSCRPVFAGLRDLRERLRTQLAPHTLEHLSMGMSNDFEVAVEEGATMVRLGTVLFEGLPEGEA